LVAQKPSAIAAQFGAINDAGLSRVPAAWPTLAEPIRRAIMALIDG
jgi:hypothetical protein